MPYTKKVWTDRTVERPLTFIMQNNTDGTITLIPSEGDIITTGTPITATSLNTIETQYDNAMADGLIEAQNWVKLFGLGGPSAIKNVDLNTISETGFYRTNRGDANVINEPAIGSGEHAYIYIIHIEHDPLWAFQCAWDYNNISQWTRTKVNDVWTSWKQAPVMDNPIFTGNLTSNGKLITNAGSQAIDIKAGPTEDHVYIGFYADSQAQTVRSGYIGYSTNLHSNLWIANEKGSIAIAPNNGGFFEFFGTADGHSAIQGEGKARIKFLSSIETVQIRNAADNNYSNLACWDMAAQNNITYVGTITDISLKEMKKDITSFDVKAIDLIRALPVYMFRYKEAEDDSQLRMGSMIEEAPDHFKYGEDRIDVGRVHWTTTKAVQELIEENDLLRDRLDSVENRLALLEKSMKQTKKKIN